MTLNNKTSSTGIQFVTYFLLWFIISPVLSLEETAAPGVIYVLLMTLPVIIYSFCGNRIKKHAYNLYAFFLFFSCLISLLFGRYGSLDLNIVKKLVFVLFFIGSMSALLSERDLTFIFKGCYCVAVLIALLIIASYLGGYAHTDSTFFLSRYSVGITGVYKNPNYLTSFMNISFFLLAYIFFQRKNTLFQNVIVLSSMTLFLVSFYFSGTRASFVTASLALVFITLEIVLKKKKGVFIILPVILLVTFIVIHYFDVIQAATELFLGNRTLTADESRTDSWMRAINNWKTAPIFGCGPNTWSVIKSSDDLNYLHNLILELLLDQGLFGFLIFVMLVFCGFKRTKRNDRFFLLTLMLVTGFPMFFQNGLWEVNFWRFIIINRIAFNYSIYSENGIKTFITNKI